ncbi:hypothetical protein GTQ34_05550 [Muricauda sp. JGD-17]|uniref:Uncharacterized protein n=1 Tax=Flagellimonas ochracea TaxID=2696472 RepID=A0A964TAR2_9FLAO|nr:hypothetical protein [Allomuricauda ochracea]NAY91378.1 hypothetical protein [Allomuricauda ochracea]
MKKIAIFLLIFSIFGCTSMKNTQNVAQSEDGKHILPPNTASNKYSKTRQGG